MTIIHKLTREQFQQFVENFYCSKYGADLIKAFQQFYTQVDDPILSSGLSDEEALDHIEAFYVEDVESWPVYREALGG